MITLINRKTNTPILINISEPTENRPTDISVGLYYKVFVNGRLRPLATFISGECGEFGGVLHGGGWSKGFPTPLWWSQSHRSCQRPVVIGIRRLALTRRGPGDGQRVLVMVTGYMRCCATIDREDQVYLYFY